MQVAKNRDGARTVEVAEEILWHPPCFSPLLETKLVPVVGLEMTQWRSLAMAVGQHRLNNSICLATMGLVESHSTDTFVLRPKISHDGDGRGKKVGYVWTDLRP